MTACTIVHDPGPCPYAAHRYHVMGWDSCRGALMGNGGWSSPFKEDRADGLFKLTIEFKHWREGSQACAARYDELNPHPMYEGVLDG